MHYCYRFLLILFAFNGPGSENAERPTPNAERRSQENLFCIRCWMLDVER